jgi:hypothetical protein
MSPGNPGGRKLFHRIVKNDLQKHWLENYPNNRWEEICKIDPRYQWKGWKKKGNTHRIRGQLSKTECAFDWDIARYYLCSGT